jgi:hypothetical protein
VIHRDDSTTLTNEPESDAEQLATKTEVYVLEDGINFMVAKAWLMSMLKNRHSILYFFDI